MRQIVLDTETTGLEPAEGHRIIELGCVELLDRRITEQRFHRYLRPDRELDPGAVEVHGITLEQLKDSPRFSEVAAEFLAFVRAAEVIIHNAPFDVGFIDHELRLADGGWGRLQDHCTVVDTLTLARELHPGQRNTLDALCKRYRVDNSQRQLHGALLDAEILAEVYLAMTGGQAELLLEGYSPRAPENTSRQRRVERRRIPVIVPSAAEMAEHERILATLDHVSGGGCIWRLQAGVPRGGEGPGF
ncbi:MAG: DNA polymerase III subunit epsilon [Gammaproteobacteria bacterium]